MNELEILKVEVATAGKANILFNRIEDNGLLNGPFSFLQFVIMKASVFWSAGVVRPFPTTTSPLSLFSSRKLPYPLCDLRNTTLQIPFPFHSRWSSTEPSGYSAVTYQRVLSGRYGSNKFAKYSGFGWMRLNSMFFFEKFTTVLIAIEIERACENLY